MSEAIDYFEGLDQALKNAGLGRPAMVLDLDRVDANLALLRESPGAGRFRLVTKSLPCGEFIDYILRAMDSRKLMAFHLPYVSWMLSALPDTDILMGKPFLPVAMQSFFNALDDTARQLAADRVQWLVDTPERLATLLALARDTELWLRVSIEIDIGLHRGGVSDTEGLGALLKVIDAHPEQLRFAGFMGYEAHIPYMPEPARAFDKALGSYGDFVDFARSQFPRLCEGELTFNTGGSKTCHLFDNEARINDVAAGSAVVKPSTFGILDDHVPALFIAAPVIRKFPRVSRKPVDPARAMSLYLYGGGWAADLVYPQEVTITPTADPPNQNLMPNQCLFETHLGTRLDLGDFVFFQPQQGDAMFQFEEIHVVRGGEIIDRWHPIPRRY